MSKLITDFIEQYVICSDKDMSFGDDQRGISSPVLFVFIGDKVEDGLDVIRRELQSRWANSKGVLFFHVSSEKMADEDGIFRFRLKHDACDRKTLRKEISMSFYFSEGQLIELNQKIRQIKNKILEFGNIYSSWERINIAVITRADDLMNIILPEITILLKSKLKEDFKIITTDFYGIIKEKNETEDYEYSLAASMSFFRELEYIQSKEFDFNKPLEVLKGGVKVNVSNSGQPVFDLLYLLEDKNENGLICEGVNEENYEIISYISLLKNKKMNIISNNASIGQYNDNQFKNDVSSGVDGQAYTSAGLSKVKRPNGTIAVTILSHFCSFILSKLKGFTNQDTKNILRLFCLDGSSLESKIDRIVCCDDGLDKMGGLMSSGLSFSNIKKCNIREAEEALYGDLCQQFFDDNYTQPSQTRLDKSNIYDEIIDMTCAISQDSRYGIYCAYEWTGESVIQAEIHKLNEHTCSELRRMEDELDDIYADPVMLQGFCSLPLFDKKNMRKFKEHMFSMVYGKKLDILRFKIKQQIIEIYESTMRQIHEKLEVDILKLEVADKQLQEDASRSTVGSDDYIGQNIMEYYRNVLGEITRDIESKKGTNPYFEDKMVGNVDQLLKNGIDAFIERVIDVCKRYILTDWRFAQNFEDELLQRANVNTEYGNREVLSREDLFKKLYDILEQNAVANCYLFQYTQKHRYEEKYFFGDYNSDFLKYAFECDKGKRTYKLGCMHERRTSGIEKLNLMGGFKISDLMYTRNCLKYYRIYTEEGFELHNVETDRLPQIVCGV